MNAPLPRVHFVFAAAAPVAVIFRRGPTKWCHVLTWNTETDFVESGAWFFGRIYPEKSDLSPDGKLLFYFAAQFGKRGDCAPGYTDIWAAVSKPPWLTALALWPMEETWGGEGEFLDDRRLRISQPNWHGPLVPHPNHLPRDLEVVERWIGRGAPRRSSSAPPAKSAWFDPVAGKGADLAGKPFRVDEGQLWRGIADSKTSICDFRSMSPVRTKSPQSARQW